MTAPNYTDKDKVNGWSKVRLQALSTSPDQTIQDLACIGLKLWDARDSARETATLQDKAIHAALPRQYVLEKVLKAAQFMQEQGYEGGFVEMNEALTAVIHQKARK